MTETRKIKESLDEEFASLIRKKGFCEKCQRTGVAYECSHVISRRNLTLRWDILNAMCLCVTCHRWWHKNPNEAEEWFKKRYPERWLYLQDTRHKLLRRTREDYEELLGNIIDGKLRKLTLDT